jgi:hypothetical protein
MSGTFFKIEILRREFGHQTRSGNRGQTVKGGYFPVPPVDAQDMRAEMS